MVNLMTAVGWACVRTIRGVSSTRVSFLSPNAAAGHTADGQRGMHGEHGFPRHCIVEGSGSESTCRWDRPAIAGPRRAREPTAVGGSLSPLAKVEG
jgi:hypothetical protein